VGYTKINLDIGLNLLGQQYVNVGDDDALNVQELITSDNLAGHDQSYNPLSELWVFENGGYKFYKYISAQDANDWDEYVDENGTNWVGKWVDANYVVADFPVDTARGLWVKTTTQSQVFFKGQVFSETNYTVNVESGLNLISNPFPVKWDIQNFTTLDLEGHDTGYNPQSEIWIFVNGGYKFYKFISAQDAVDWDEYVDENGTNWVNKWVDANYVVADEITVDPGYGFWVRTSSNASMKFFRKD